MEVIVQGNKLNGLIQAVGFQNMKVSGDSGVQFVIMMNKVSLTNCTQPDDSNYNNDKSISQSVTNNRCLVCVKCEKYAFLATFRPPGVHEGSRN